MWGPKDALDGCRNGQRRVLPDEGEDRDVEQRAAERLQQLQDQEQLRRREKREADESYSVQDQGQQRDLLVADVFHHQAWRGRYFEIPIPS